MTTEPRGRGRVKSPCPCCGRTVASNKPWPATGGKCRAPHKCPHGKPCWSGDKHAPVGGWNPGGPVHAKRCPACAEAVRRHYTSTQEVTS